MNIPNVAEVFHIVIKFDNFNKRNIKENTFNVMDNFSLSNLVFAQ
jgi:hypothetical protein